MKKFIVCLGVISVALSFSYDALAKKQQGEISAAIDKKYKPKNQKILKKLWSKGLKSGGSKKHFYPESSVPLVSNGTIYVGTHGRRFYSINASTGKPNWVFENDEPISSQAALSGNQVVFSDLGGKVVALDATSGQSLWSQYFNREILGQPLIFKDRIFVLKGEQEIIAMDAGTGRILWNKFIRTYVKKMTMRGRSSLETDGQNLYVGLADGHLYKLNSSDGRTLWDKNLNIPLRSFKDIDSRVVFSGDSLYIGGYFGAVYRIQKSSGQIIWKSMDVATGTPIAISNDLVFVSDQSGRLVAIDQNDGKQVWFHDFDSAILSAPVVFQDKVFVSSYESNAYVFRQSDGLQLQKLGLGDGSLNDPIVVDDEIYVLTNGATLVKVGLN